MISYVSSTANLKVGLLLVECLVLCSHLSYASDHHAFVAEPLSSHHLRVSCEPSLLLSSLSVGSGLSIFSRFSSPIQTNRQKLLLFFTTTRLNWLPTWRTFRTIEKMHNLLKKSGCWSSKRLFFWHDSLDLLRRTLQQLNDPYENGERPTSSVGERGIFSRAGSKQEEPMGISPPPDLDKLSLADSHSNQQKNP